MKLEISPQVIESYKRLDYTHWHALAELVDNSTYWYELNRDTILKYDPDALKCEVRITYDVKSSLLRIADNSIGMDLETLQSAMVIGRKTKRPGRSVYGMGLKTACIWMGKKFSIKTKKAGLTTGYHVTVDYDKIMAGDFELGFQELKNCHPNEHYTVIEISQLDELIQTRRINKIKEYLSSIYREDFRDKKLTLTFNDESIDWSDENHYLFLRDKTGEIYKRSFSFDIEGKTAKGWIGIMQKGGKSVGGLTILQNKRVIRGFPDTWKPEGLFGGGGEGLTTSLSSQRLVGEIHMDGFDVTHTKDNIKWSGGQEELLDKLLTENFNDFKKTAASFKKNELVPSKPDFSDQEVDEAIDEVTDVIGSPQFIDAINQIPITINKDPVVTDNIYIPEIEKTVSENKASFECQIGSVLVRVFLKQTSTQDIYLDYETGPSGDVINMTINLSHPYLAASKPHLEQYILGCIYDALAEYHCNRQTSVIHARTIREIKNNLMKTSIKISEDAN